MKSVFLAFIFIFGFTIALAITITIGTLLLLSKINPSSGGGFNLFGGHELLAAVIVGTIYGGILGVILGLFLAIFFVLVVMRIEGQTRSLLLMALFGLLAGIVPTLLFYLSEPSRFNEEGSGLPVFMVIFGFVVSFLPQFIVKTYLR